MEKFPPVHPSEMRESTSHKKNAPIPFEAFAAFERLEGVNPILACEPPEWAAAAHAFVTDDAIHYLWGRRRKDNYWVLMHSAAPAGNPAQIAHDPRNPILLPSSEGFDDYTIEYPFPFYNPADRRYYVYYLGRRRKPPKQTGLLVGDGDFGVWTRVCHAPVIAVANAYERMGSSHPSVAIAGETIHIIYTGESAEPPTICYATARTSDPATVAKDPANPVFKGSGQAWDSWGVREAEIFMGPQYFHIFYGGSDGETWRIGHVRTRDFHTFEPNPHNPIFTPSPDPKAWDCDGLLTPQVFEIDDRYFMLYAGLRGNEWQTGLAATPVKK